MIRTLIKVLKKENGFSEWYGLILALSFITLLAGFVFDLRAGWDQKNLYNEVVLSVKDLFEIEGGVTPYIEYEILDRLTEAGYDTSTVVIEGSPQSNYGTRIYYTATITLKMKLGADEIEKTYKKKVIGTSAYVPFS